MTRITQETLFREIPVQASHLLMVASGIDVAVAFREAEDLEDAVRCLLAFGIESGMDGRIAYLCEFAMETASALRKASVGRRESVPSP